MKKVLTVGVFDLLHIGHIELFRKAKALGDYLIVAVQDSDCVFQFKPDASLVYSTEERCYMVSAIRYVDEVVVYRNVGDIVDEVDFDLFAKGPDQSHAGFQRVVDYCGENDKEVVVMARTEGISSSELKDLIKCMK
ncbi:adenylyltransferase/cytidyltransferase family protein [Bacteroides sp. KH569_7]|uniref:Adenylyltransferase/cytidyltransferase family protein n=1 Tax=Bacteroides muris (ex Fokt et al. 2023) TaxID=2937417 RepID=A0A9X2NVE1_9BACE|nr:adenylyltransferase/cytidyltransferase family protein [Bacteroides muris (ex Fokt et al. 2023)]MCR6505996.1 adenylyltransferase/cytidyltransferase family protein [Bacteroides muris (ex Fokt et al. 2023)]MCR6506720.1 adenylyltransferase/cytidyltransferase family protein [Bacteroides muris (ex Fokt et al. 2023)]